MVGLFITQLMILCGPQPLSVHGNLAAVVDQLKAVKALPANASVSPDLQFTPIVMEGPSADGTDLKNLLAQSLTAKWIERNGSLVLSPDTVKRREQKIAEQGEFRALLQKRVHEIQEREKLTLDSLTPEMVRAQIAREVSQAKASKWERLPRLALGLLTVLIADELLDVQSSLTPGETVFLANRPMGQISKLPSRAQLQVERYLKLQRDPVVVAITDEAFAEIKQYLGPQTINPLEASDLVIFSITRSVGSIIIRSEAYGKTGSKVDTGFLIVDTTGGFVNQSALNVAQPSQEVVWGEESRSIVEAVSGAAATTEADLKRLTRYGLQATQEDILVPFALDVAESLSKAVPKETVVVVPDDSWLLALVPNAKGRLPLASVLNALSRTRSVRLSTLESAYVLRPALALESEEGRLDRKAIQAFCQSLSPSKPESLYDLSRVYASGVRVDNWDYCIGIQRIMQRNGYNTSAKKLPLAVTRWLGRQTEAQFNALFEGSGVELNRLRSESTLQPSIDSWAPFSIKPEDPTEVFKLRIAAWPASLFHQKTFGRCKAKTGAMYEYEHNGQRVVVSEIEFAQNLYGMYGKLDQSRLPEVKVRTSVSSDISVIYAIDTVGSVEIPVGSFASGFGAQIPLRDLPPATISRLIRLVDDISSSP